jgi:MFS family permease
MRLFYGWVIVGAGFSVLFCAYGLHFAYGVIVPHMSEELGLDRASATAPFSVYIVVFSLLSIITGRITDTVGPRSAVLTGGLLFAIAYVGLSRATSSLDLYLWLGLLAGVGMSAAFVPVNATVVKWFVRRRGLALAAAGSGGNAASMVTPLLAAALIPVFGWRGTVLALGVGCGVALMLLATLLVRDPESKGLRPDGTGPASANPHGGRVPDEVSWTLSEARTTAAFWVILGAYSLSWMTAFFPGAHLPFIAKDQGYDDITGGTLLSIYGAGVLSGRWLIGWVSDTIGRKMALGIGFLLQTLGFLSFTIAASIEVFFGAALLVGFGISVVVTLFAATIGDYFGRANVGAIAGFVYAIASAASGAGPFGGGLIRDAARSYDPAFLICAGLNAAALLLILFLRPPQRAG